MEIIVMQQLESLCYWLTDWLSLLSHLNIIENFIKKPLMKRIPTIAFLLLVEDEIKWRMMQHWNGFCCIALRCEIEICNNMHRRQTLFVWFMACIKVKMKYFPIFRIVFFILIESKGVRISLTREGKINKALHMNRNWLFFFGNLSYSLKLWGVMNSILFDYANQTEKNSKISLIEFYLLNWSNI